MPRITLRIPEVKPSPEDRPPHCPHCQNPALQGWGKAPTKPLKDPKVSHAQPHRYRCPSCRKTFRHYPEGVTSATQSQRTQVLSALFWALGLPLRGVAALLAHVGVPISHTTVQRNVRALLQEVQGEMRGLRARVLGVDGFGVRVGGKPKGVLLCVEMGEGMPVAVREVEEKDPRAVAKVLRPLVKALGVEVLVSDDLGTYRTVAEDLGLSHQVCAFHLLRWAGRALSRLRSRVPEGWREVVETAWGVVRARPPDGGKRLFLLYRQVVQGVGKRKEGPLWELARVLLRLSEGWRRYTLDRRVSGVPSTNNRVEQAIGRVRWRVLGMRGVKTWAGLEAAVVLPQVRVV